MNNMNEYLEVFSNILQLANFSMLLEDANNTDLLKYLQHQDNDYLKIIIEQNKEIIRLLKGGDK